MLATYSEGVLAPIQPPKLKDNSLSAVCECLFNILTTTLHTLQLCHPSATELTIGLHNRQGISWLAKQLLASEELCSVGLVMPQMSVSLAVKLKNKTNLYCLRSVQSPPSIVSKLYTYKVPSADATRRRKTFWILTKITKKQMYIYIQY
jgi:hypothetical protein